MTCVIVRKLAYALSIKHTRKFNRTLSMAAAPGTMYKLFKNTEKEVTELIHGTVTGEIPLWVRGSLYRNGPGMHDVGQERYNHFFDGLAMIQRFHMFDGKVTYQRRFLQSDTYKKVTKAESIVVGEFGTNSMPDPCKNIFQRFLTCFEKEEISDNTVVTVFPYGDELFTATETVYWNKIDPETLDKTEKVKLSRHVDVHMTVAHPHTSEDGTLFNIGHSFTRGIFTALMKFPPKQDGQTTFPKGELVTRIPSSWKIHFNYLHSFAMTENYLIFVQQPLLYNIPKLIMRRYVTKFTPKTSLTWYPDIKTRFRIIDKTTGEEVNAEVKYEADAFVFFHHANAYEDDGHVVIDICCYKDSAVLDAFYMETLTSQTAEMKFASLYASLKRFVLPLTRDTKAEQSTNLVTLADTNATCHGGPDKRMFCTGESLANISFEFPQINYSSYNGKKYQYVYGVGMKYDTIWKNTVVKIDVQKKSYVEWKEEDCHVSEPVFVPKPDCQAEDEGVVVSAVNKILSDGTTQSFLLVLDAKDMAELARVEFDGIDRFPRDLHGAYTKDK